MASYQHLLQHSKPRFESPAKVFAKLKSKVRREGASAKEQGLFTGNDPLSSVRERHGAEFKSPRKRADSTWVTDGLKENHRTGSYRVEAQALTLSPISSPQKTFGYSYADISGRPVEDTTPVFTPRKRGFLESTAVVHPLSVPNRQPVHAGPPQIRDFDVFRVPSRTPVKMQPAGEEDCAGSVFEEDCAPLDNLRSRAYMFSPMKKRLRKRKLASSTKEVCSESRPQKRRTSSSEDDTLNDTSVEDLGHLRGFSADRVPCEPVLPLLRSNPLKRCSILLENIPPMSPAKMFAYMKQRESRPEQQEVHKLNSSTRNLFKGGHVHQSRDSPPSTAPNTWETEDAAFRSVPDSAVPVSRSRAVESADSESDTDPSEDPLIPAEPPQPILLEDPLVLNTPRVCIPKKQEARFPSESVIHLKRWFMRRNHKGLFVDGIHREENIPWNSNIIVDRVSNHVLKTISGRVYILVGKMTVDVHSGFPKWFLKKFVNGFPPNWKTLYEKFLSESREYPSRETQRKNEGRSIAAKTKSDKSSVIVPVAQNRSKPVITLDSCPPSSSSSTKMSRSGRVIKPPLEYWRGGRVILDAHMNVTIHECYDTSICNSDVTTTVSARALQKSARVFPPGSKGRDQFESSRDKEASAPLRKTRAPLRKFKTAKVNPEEKPSDSPEAFVQTLSSPEERSGRRKRSSPRLPATERTSYVDAVPQKQSKPEKSSTQRSKKQSNNTKRTSPRALESKRVGPAPRAPPESPVNDETSQYLSSDDDFSSRRKKQEKGGHRKRGGKVLNKSRPSRVFPSSPENSVDSERELRKTTRVTPAAQTQTKPKQSKSSKNSPPTEPLPTQSSKNHKAKKGKAPIPQEQEEDKWTETELMNLKEAVAFYPKHMAGYWAKVARLVETRSAEECHNQYTSQGTFQTPTKKPKKTRKSKKEKMEAPKDPVPDHPVISARVGTLRRKQQVREFLEAMPREDVEDVFSSEFMQNKRAEIPSMCPSDDQDLSLSNLEPLTPRSTGFPEVKTPQCLHITPGMMGSPNRSIDDKYVYQLQRRMKKSQFNVCKQAPASKRFTPTPSVKRTTRRCGNTENDTFVWEMFPGDDEALSESEDEDFYFSNCD